MKRFFQIFIAICMLAFSASNARAAESACAKVTIEIAQELTLERVAFDAKLVMTNNLPDKDLENVRVDVHIEDSDGNVKNEIFFVRLSSNNNIAAVDGTGVVQAGTKAEVHWLIIPSPGAGGESPDGVIYWIGATLTYTLDGNEDVIPINPDRITVRPTAQMVLDYFLPYAVLADNPFTPEVEAPVPYELAVRVVNDGFGPASKLKIDSAQPKIVENESGLLVDFQLLGASVNDSAVSPSLTVDMGDVASKDVATAYWEMISTLSGRFEEFDVTFSHSDELGGELTSLIRETNAYYLTHRIKVDLPGRDYFLDFLSDTDRDADHLPDTIFESEYPGGTGDMADSQSPVTVIYPVSAPQRPTAVEPSVGLTLDTTTDQATEVGWIYTRLNDPAQGMLKLLDVVRADGVHLDSNNFWVDEGLNKDYQTIYTLQFVDFRTGSGTPSAYTLVYAEPLVDLIPPTTTIVFDGPDASAEDLTTPVYITPDTRIVLTARDNDGGSGVDRMLRKVSDLNADFVAALPFNLASGTYTLEYYSIDRADNQEAVKTVDIVVDDSAPSISLFTAVPDTFTPYAPRGVAADRTVDFLVNAEDTVGTMQVIIEVLDASDAVIRTLDAEAESGVDLTVNWDGRDDSGMLVPTGSFAARLSVSDGLESLVATEVLTHTSTAEVNVLAAEWFTEEAVDANPAGEQMYPDVFGTRVVWQDKRNGNWDIYMKDTASGTVARVTDNAADQQRASIDGDVIVWQDLRSGNSDVYGYDLSSSSEIVISSEAGAQEKPVVSGEWVVWQGNQNGNWDIFAKNITSGEAIQITSHERDQIRPDIFGNRIVWEDYRHGLGEVYTYDLSSRTEQRMTVEIDNQTLPDVSESALVWTDQRNGQKDIYSFDAAGGELRVTYGVGDHTQATVYGTVLVYTDFESGSSDPNISFQDLLSGVGGRLVSDPARQEEAALGDGLVVWQDDRSGVYQIYMSGLTIEPTPIDAVIRPGFNLISVGQRLASMYPTASALMAANPNGVKIERVLGLNNLHGTYTERTATGSGSDFNLAAGMGLVVYAENEGLIDVADIGEEGEYTLLAGTNHIGILTVPHGYSASGLMNSIGLDNIQSVRRFDNSVGAWQTVAVRGAGENVEIIGQNFMILPGDGLAITMKNRVDGWKL